MRRLLFLSAAALLVSGCSDSTPPSVATSVTIVPGSVSLDALGATRVVRATVSDQNGKPMQGAAIAWSSNTGAATVLGVGGDSAVVTSVTNGAATITAQAGSAAGTAQVQVAQVAASLEKLGVDDQKGAAGAPLGSPIRVQVRDRLGAPVAGQTVSFTITTGGGSVSTPTAVTGADGTAATSWTLGATAGSNTVAVTLPGTSVPMVVFTATATAASTATLSIQAGGFQAAMEGTAVPVAPSVIVRDASGTPVPGVTVNFTVTSGGGSVTGGSATTDASGVAAVTRWVLGAADLNTLTASAAGVMGSPVVFRGAGCSGRGAAFEVTVCITTAMTASQRQVFQASAARWGSIIKGDRPDVAGAIPQDACGAGTPSVSHTYDDLLIFAAVADIDGPGQVLGQAAPCFIRETGKLPVIGMMRFDAADLNALENSGQLGNVILHEMGHVLGIGTLWSLFSLLQNRSTPESQVDTYFNGAGAIAGFDAVGGSTYTGGAKVPVENTGGAGTMNAHWRESVLRNELMTGYLNAGSNPLSVVTARSLGDLGYNVDPGAADGFFLTLSIRAQRDGDTPGLKMHDDVYHGPLYTITPRGARTRIR